MNLSILPGRFAVCKLAADAAIPAWAAQGEFCSITRTSDELSIVCEEIAVPSNVNAERGWRCLRVAGQIPFSTVGVLSSLTEPLAKDKISLFAISTFDTDYLLVKESDFQRAIETLRAAGHSI